MVSSERGGAPMGRRGTSGRAKAVSAMACTCEGEGVHGRPTAVPGRSGGQCALKDRPCS